MMTGVVLVTSVLILAMAPTLESAAPEGADPLADRFYRRQLDPADAQRFAEDRTLLRLKVGAFDPVLGLPRLGDLLERVPSGPQLRDAACPYHLVQFDRAVTSDVWNRLRDLGVEVLSYIPNNALLVRPLPEVPASTLQSLPARYVGEFPYWAKLSSGLFHRLQELDEQGGEMIAIDASLFRGEDPGSLAQAVAGRFRDARVKFVRSRSLPRVMFEAPADTLRPLVGSLLRDCAVAHVDERLPLELYNDQVVWIGQSYDRVNGPSEADAPDPKPYTLSATIWNQGLIGTGQIVAVADTDLEYGTCFWNDPANPVTPQSVSPPGALSTDPNHRKLLAVNGTFPFSLVRTGTFRHGTHVSATVAADNLANLAGGTSAGHDHGDGMAPGAKIIFEDISIGDNGECLQATIVNSVEDLLQQEYDAGARLSTNSWGSGTGQYGSEAAEVDSFVWQHENMIAFFAAGNDGANGFSRYASAKDCVAVGATQNWEPDFPSGPLDPENMAGFSSRGPAEDGRVKPDLAAPGDRVDSNKFPTQYISDENDPLCDPLDPNVCFPNFGGCYLTDTSQTCATGRLRGTSMATPAAAGLAALVREYFMDGFYPGGEEQAADAMTPSAALLKAVLLNGARNMTGELRNVGPLEDAPSNVQGWGRVMLDDALYFSGDARRLKLMDVPNANGLATGETSTSTFSVTASDQALKLTLAWTDPPGNTAASAALVNNIDLELEAPDGTLYRGNQWTADDINTPGDKESLANASGTDALNNIEGILVQSPEVGLHTVTIGGTDVPGHAGVFTQGFALVITGAVVDPSGSVPDGSNVPGTPLTIDKATGSDITLSWGGSCLAGDNDYEIYEGTIGDFTSHTAKFCTTGGVTTKTFTPAAGATYYLVVPRGLNSEGSYGTDSSSSERPQGLAACLDQAILPCE